MQTLTRNVTPVTLTEEDKLFADTIQSTQLDWTSILDDYTDWADWDDWENGSTPYDEDAEYNNDDFDNADDWDDMYDNELRLDAHKQPRARRFRRLRNKTFLPFRRYGNSFDGFEGRRNDSPNEFTIRHETLASIRKQELQEPLKVLKANNFFWRTGQARYELRTLGYYINWRKTIDFELRRNNKKQHALYEPETAKEAYSDNPYGKNGIEPSWRKIGAYIPANPEVPTSSIITNDGRVMEVRGVGGGGIRTWHAS